VKSGVDFCEVGISEPYISGPKVRTAVWGVENLRGHLVRTLLSLSVIPFVIWAAYGDWAEYRSCGGELG
jgi:hypothetical protein